MNLLDQEMLQTDLYAFFRTGLSHGCCEWILKNHCFEEEYFYEEDERADQQGRCYASDRYAGSGIGSWNCPGLRDPDGPQPEFTDGC